MGGSPIPDGPYYACQVPFIVPYFDDDLEIEQFIPCYNPPWARLVAVDLKEGTIKWTRPYGAPLSPTGALKEALWSKVSNNCFSISAHVTMQMLVLNV